MTMTTPRFMDNPQYAEYVRLLKALHRRIAEDKDDDEADALRDEMDAPWYSLSEEEIERVDGLAADLYTLEEAPAAPPQSDNGAVGSLRADLRRAWEARDWEGGLDLLRRHPGLLPPYEAAFLRGWCWNELGDPATADLFFHRAAELAPDNANPPVADVVAQLRAGHTEEADRYARAIITQAA
jgi:hypothetical protein